MPITDPQRDALTPLSDDAVVDRVRAGEQALFEVLMRRHNQRLYRVIRAVMRDESEVEDVMQEAYVRAYACLDQFEGRSQFVTWLTRIAVHEALARSRKRRRFVALDDGVDIHAIDRARLSGGDPEHDAHNEELRGVLTAAIDALPAPLRTVFVLREIEGLSSAETATCLEISAENVRVRLHRSRSALRESIEARLGTARELVYAFPCPRCDRVVAAVFARLPA